MKLNNTQFGLVTSHYYISMDLQCFKEINYFCTEYNYRKMVKKYLMNDNLDFLKKTLLSNR